jgi:HEAT repeat protein
MSRILLLVLVTLPSTNSQDGKVLTAAEWVERLRSDRAEERDEAERRLRDLGVAALSHLRRATVDRDDEVARRASRLVQILETLQALGPNVSKKIPKVDSLLGGADGHGWTEVFLKAHLVPGVSKEALEKLAPRALLGIRDIPEAADAISKLLEGSRRKEGVGDEIHAVLCIVAERDLQSVVPTLLTWLSHPSTWARELAALTLGHLGVREAAPGVVRLLRDPNPHCRADAATALGALRLEETIPDLAAAVTDDCDWVVNRAEAALHAFPREKVYAALKQHFGQEGILRRGNLMNALLEFRSTRQAHPRIRFWAYGLADVERAIGEILIDREHPDAPERLVPLLQDPRLGVRLSALNSLREIGARGKGEAIIPLLQDPEPSIRQSAVEALAEFGVSNASARLIPLLKDKEVVVRSKTALTLSKLKSEEALPALLDLLGDQSEEVRKYAAWALEELRHPKSAARLALALKDSDAEVWQSALRTLWRIDPIAHVPAIANRLGRGENAYWFPDPPTGLLRTQMLAELTRLLRDPDPVLRRGTLRLISDLYFREAGDSMIPLTEDPAPEVREQAVRTLSWLGIRKAAPKIAARITDESGDIRRWACWKLDELGAQATPELLQFLAQRGYDEAVADALVDVCAKEAVPRLAGFLSHKSPDVRCKILGYLSRLKAKDSAEAIAVLLADPEPSVRKAAIETLCRLDVREALPAIRGRLGDTSGDVRLAAVEALLTLRSPDASRDLPALLEDESSAVRAAACKAIGGLHVREAIPSLMGLLEEADYHVRQSAAASLGNLGATQAVPALMVNLRRDARNGWSAYGAIMALANLNVREAAPDILRLFLQELRSCGDPEPALQALKTLDAGGTLSALVRFVDDENSVQIPFPNALRELFGKGVSSVGGCSGESRTTLGLTAGALISLGSPEAIPVIRRLMKERDEGPRWPVTQAFIALADASLSPELLALTRHEHYLVRLRTIEKLVRLGRIAVVQDILPLLKDPVSDVRRAAILALERLKDPGALESVLPLLTDPDRWVRIQAASALCSHGDRRGLDLLLDEGYELNALNAIREPRVWARLRECRLAGPLDGDARSLLKKLSAQVGLTIEIPDLLPLLFESSLSQVRQLKPDQCPTVRYALEELMNGLERGCYVVEADRIRVLSPRNARLFWQEWTARNIGK